MIWKRNQSPKPQNRIIKKPLTPPLPPPPAQDTRKHAATSKPTIILNEFDIEKIEILISKGEHNG